MEEGSGCDLGRSNAKPKVVTFVHETLGRGFRMCDRLGNCSSTATPEMFSIETMQHRIGPPRFCRTGSMSCCFAKKHDTVVSKMITPEIVFLRIN